MDIDPVFLSSIGAKGKSNFEFHLLIERGFPLASIDALKVCKEAARPCSDSQIQRKKPAEPDARASAKAAQVGVGWCLW
jgi:hypothetical protein